MFESAAVTEWDPNDRLQGAQDTPDDAVVPTAQDIENRALFIESMANPMTRAVAFDVVERNCRMRFRVGQEGIKVYARLLTYVQEANVAEAVDEFERRFLPMLDQVALKRMLS
jgi:hypothetical protein